MTRPLTTLKTGEVARVDLKGRKRSGISSYTGVVTKVDDRAIRLEPVFATSSFGGSLPTSQHINGAAVVPWTSIESIRIEPKEQQA